jgi:hypothetical protein
MSAEIVKFPGVYFKGAGAVCSRPGSDGSSAIILPLKLDIYAWAGDCGPAVAVDCSARPLRSGNNFRLCDEAEQKRVLSEFFGPDEVSGD